MMWRQPVYGAPFSLPRRSPLSAPGHPSRPVPRRRTVALVAAALVLAAGTLSTVGTRSASALDNGVALTPPMGWNTWNSFGCAIDEQLVRNSADALVASGMTGAGYDSVVVDDCWFDPQRDPEGNLRADRVRFPGGMKALGDHLHSMGLKFGIYQVPTDRTCAQRGNVYPGSTGSLGHERQDAETFAAWGVDYLKYDWCSPVGTLGEQIAAFSTMRDALRDTGRPIVYSINPNSFHADKTGATYDWSAVADMWRTTEDITSAWDTHHTNDYAMGVMNIVRLNGRLGHQAGPGHWNDPDMLEVGVPGMSEDEFRSHFSLWAQMAAPLIAGNKPADMTPAVAAVLTNREVIAVDQDGLGQPARIVADSGTDLVTVRELTGGDRSVTLTNTGDRTATLTTGLSGLGITGAPSCTLRDLWTGESTTTTGPLTATLAPHATAMYRVTPGRPTAARGTGPAADHRGPVRTR